MEKTFVIPTQCKARAALLTNGQVQYLISKKTAMPSNVPIHSRATWQPSSVD